MPRSLFQAEFGKKMEKPPDFDIVPADGSPGRRPSANDATFLETLRKNMISRLIITRSAVILLG